MYSEIQDPYQSIQVAGTNLIETIGRAKLRYKEFQELRRAPHVFALSTPDSRERGDVIVRKAQSTEIGYVLLDDFELPDTDSIDELEMMMSQLVDMKERHLGYPSIDLERAAFIATPYRIFPRYRVPSPQLVLHFERDLPTTERKMLVDANIDDINGWIPKGKDYYHATRTSKRYVMQPDFLSTLGYTLDIIPESQLDTFQPSLVVPR